MTTPSPIPLDFKYNNYWSIEDLANVDGKCNQLQEEMESLRNELRNSNNYNCRLRHHHHHYHFGGKVPSPSSPQIVTTFGAGFIGINNYPPQRLKFLIGKHHKHIEKLEKMFQINIKIPAISQQPHAPIIITPRRFDTPVLIFLPGISRVLYILMGKH